MNKEKMIEALRKILKVYHYESKEQHISKYHYESKEQHISKDVVTSLENLLGSLLK